MRADVLELCAAADEHGFAAVCVNPIWVATAVAALRGPARVVTVAGFPLGAQTARLKAAEARAAIAAGAHEVDMVLQLGWLLSAVPAGGGPIDEAALAAVKREIAGVVRALREADGPVAASERRLKVILETALLDERQKTVAARAAVAAGADFVKTCTGFSGGGATVADVELLRAAVGRRARIKASGGIRDRQTALRLVAAGADRLGCSASLALVAGE